MKEFRFIGIACLTILLSACSTIKAEHPVDITKTEKPAATTCQKAKAKVKATCPKNKNPINVSLYTKGEKPKNSYKILGIEAVSKYNRVGIKKQEACIHDSLRSLAAKMGGDAVINIKYDKKIVEGTVITYQKNKNSHSSV